MGGLKKSHFTLHNPLPTNLVSECKKATDILTHLIKPARNKIDETLIPPKILDNARGIAVMTILKIGFLWSGRAGSGLVVARLPDGRWSAPSMIAAAGAGVGGQIGGQLTDVVFILNTADAVKAFSHGGNVTFGANLSVAAGPVGRSAEATGTVVNLAPVYSYSKTKGLFVGVSFEGSVIITRNDANSKFYKSKVSAADILTGKVEPPVEAEALYRVLNLKFKNGGFSSDDNNSDAGSIHSRAESTASTNYNKNQITYPTPTSATLPSSSSTSPNIPTKGAIPYNNNNNNNYNAVPNRSAPPPPVPPKARKIQMATALYAFNGERDTDLAFNKGDVIEIVEKSDNPNEWWVGKLNGKQGEFPGTYVRII